MDLVNKLWGFCNKLRHDGVDPADYIEQLTYLLFLKMAKEKAIAVPEGFDWESLISKDNDSVLSHLDLILNRLKIEPGILGDIFSEPVSRVRNSHILKSLIKEIDTIKWTAYDADVVGLAFEELIGKVANEGKKVQDNILHLAL
ncbi:type I restriction-modification system subunit M N-terminal domain-containing protein [Pedobacter panaciterrae]